MSPDPAFHRVDLALRRLRRPNTLDDRLAALRALVEYWHGPITPADAVPPGDLVSLALPGPLSW